MAKPDDSAEGERETQWGTWEELLLACAVNRYGAKSWDSIAIEVRRRSSASTLHHLLTPHNCKQKYHDLKRRYSPNRNGVVSEFDGVDDDDDDKTKTETIPWLDELRKLRVTELKREVERYDLSIVSLQLKVKTLKEEREQSLKESENGGEKSHLGNSVEIERKEEEKREGEAEPEKVSPGSVAGKPVSVDEFDRDSQSVNESNSTDPKRENLETGTEEDEKEPEPVRIGDEKPDPTGDSGQPFRDDSCDDSSDSIAKEPVRELAKVEPEGGVSDSPELRESVAESKGGSRGEGTKESSDVQSSASKSRKEAHVKLLCGSSSGDERENEDQSPAIIRASVESQPFVDLLEILLSHKLGSVFERRFESQETPKYRNLIRQHIDLEIIRTRVEEGWYLGCNLKFFRDLLLLVNNAIVFFGKTSAESVAAIDLRQLISKEMAQRYAKLDLSAEERTSLPLVSLPSKPDSQPCDSLLLKPKISGPMIVCRKRSSIAAKASTSSSGADRKREQAAALAEGRPVLDWKQPNKSSVNAEPTEEYRISKKRARDRIASGSRSSRQNGKNRTNTNPTKNSEAISNQNQGKRGSPSEHSEPKAEKKNNPTTADVKKQSAANFLNRMKRGLSSNTRSLLDTLKSSTLGADNHSKGGAEQKRSGNGKGDGRKDQVSRRSSGRRQAKEPSSPGKRSVGRPPKRAAAASPLLAVSGKRGREVDETVAVASRHPKKKSRK